MNAIALTLVTAVLGVDVGWQPIEGGGFEYIIQIEPQLLDTLKSGNDLVSDLPPQLWGVRSYRITVGNRRLPRIGNRPAEESETPGAPPDAAEPAGATPPAASPSKDSAATSVELKPPAPFTPPETARDLGTVQASKDDIAGQSNPLTTEAEFQLAVVTAKLPPAPEVVPDIGPQSDAQQPSAASAAAAAPAGAASKPWGMLTLATLGLFLSLGFNAFLGWVTWGFRQRYAALVHEMDPPHAQTA